MGGLSIWHWLIVLGVVVLIFGTKKLRNAGGDLGSAVKNFRQAMKEGDDEAGRKPDSLGGGERSDAKTREHEDAKH